MMVQWIGWCVDNAHGSSEEVSKPWWQALDRVSVGVEWEKIFRLSPFRGIW